MLVSKETLINQLPAYSDEWVLVKQDQDVNDIIKDILRKHKQFAEYYDYIALYFNRNNIQEICDCLYDFCASNIRYEEEKDKLQTTAIPTGILIRGKGDCKHFASFIGGCLDGIERLTGKKIDWCYRFALYDYDELLKAWVTFREPLPHHVFVVVKDKGEELWIDPTPHADKKDPVWKKDKFIKTRTMALYSNIGTIGIVDPATIQVASEATKSVTNFLDNLFSMFVIGDQVPHYPIKSKNTYDAIIAAYRSNFPDPKSVAEANALIVKLDTWLQAAIDKGAYTKGKEVDTTYHMIGTELKNELLAYIANASDTPMVPAPAPGQLPTKLPTPPSPQPQQAGFSLLPILLIGGLALGMMNKKRSVTGISFTNLALLGLGGYLVFKVIPGAGNKKQDLINWINSSEGDTPESKAAMVAVFNAMSSQEINDTWSYIFNYLGQGVNTIPGDLLIRIQEISEKYNIFT